MSSRNWDSNYPFCSQFRHYFRHKSALTSVFLFIRTDAMCSSETIQRNVGNWKELVFDCHNNRTHSWTDLHSRTRPKTKNMGTLRFLQRFRTMWKDEGAANCCNEVGTSRNVRVTSLHRRVVADLRRPLTSKSIASTATWRTHIRVRKIFKTKKKVFLRQVFFASELDQKFHRWPIVWKMMER